MTRRYAAETRVTEEASMAEIRRLLKRYGATGYSLTETVFGSGVIFKIGNRTVKLVMAMPDLAEERFSKSPTGRHRTADKTIVEAWQQECRRMWRALGLVIKAKLEAVESGISTFDEEFLAHIVMPNGQTVGAANLPGLREKLGTANLPALLARNEMQVAPE